MVQRRSVLKGLGGAAALAALGGPMAGTGLAAHDDGDYRGVRVNQVGYPTGGTKIAIATSQAMDVSSVSSFEIVDADTGASVDQGSLSAELQDEAGTTQTLKWADFSDFDQPGEYKVVVGDEESHPFQIGDASEIYAPLLRDVGRLYTLKRSNTRIEDPYTGLHIGPGHTQDEEAIVAEPIGDWLEDYEAGDTISVPNGWYDAGDYGKYVNPTGITVAQMLLAYERNPEAFHVGQFYVDDTVDDPELGTMPDVLVECKEALKFLEQMQRPNGSLFYKLAAKDWPGMEEAPEDDDRDRYVFGTSSAGTAMACGAMAMAARVYEDHDPAFAAEMLECAEDAWAWLEDNPDLVWEMSDGQDDGSGGYGRAGFDEPDRFWAAAELLRTTGDSSYDQWIQNTDLGFSGDGGVVDDLPGDIAVPIDWNNPVGLGHYAYFWADGDLKGTAHDDEGTAAEGLNGPFWATEVYLGEDSNSDADRWMTGVYDYYWGHLKSGISRAIQGIWSIEMFDETHDADWEHWIHEEEGAALIHEPFHHALGRSATGYSYVTGYGEKSTMRPHDRIVQSQEMDDPIPGMLVGGPHNSDSLVGEGDCTLDHIDADTEHLMAYIDEHCSYATNEWAINYTAPLFFMLAELVGEITETPEPETVDPIDPGPGNGDEPSGLDVNGDGNDAQDLSGDGLYEDVTGDGNLGFNDVVTFFEEHNGDVVQSNVEYFDFSGSGNVGFNDVVALFEML